jgi:hypothetical protein
VGSDTLTWTADVKATDNKAISDAIAVLRGELTQLLTGINYRLKKAELRIRTREMKFNDVLVDTPSVKSHLC